MVSSFAIAPLSVSLAQEPINVTADSLINRSNTGEPRTELVGHVRFQQGSLNGTADRAIQFPGRNYVEMHGNVVIHQDTLSLSAPTVTYDGNKRFARGEGKVIFRDRADKITSEWASYDMNVAVAEFHTNVRATKDSTILTCDDLTYIRGTQTMIAKGNVLVQSDSGSLVCDTLIDARSIGERTALGNVALSNDSLLLYCHSFYESKPTHTMIAAKNVEAYSLANKTIQFGDSLIRNTITGHSFVPLNPLLLIIDTSSRYDSLSGKVMTVADTLLIRSKTMEAFPDDSGAFIATDSVFMLRTNFSASCGKLVYHKSSGVMNMFAAKRQHVWYDSTEINGDSIVMFQHNSKPERIVAIGHAFATTPFADPTVAGRVSQLSSKTMTLSIIGDTVRSLVAVDNALSIYFVSSDNKPNGLNRASGDSIRIDFEHNTARRISVLSGTVCEFWPEKYIGSRGAAFRLGNYERYYDQHPKRESFQLYWVPKVITTFAQ